MNPPASAPARPKQGLQPQADAWSVQPQRIKRHRTGGDVFKGLGALLVLAVLLGAIPYALVRYFGWPLPHHLPNSHFFNQPITPQVLLDALAVIVWLAWAQFAACVVVEFLAAVRGIGMPVRVPAAGPSQFLARQLVAALLLITASAASFVPNLAHLGSHDSPPSPAAPTTATAGVLPGVTRHTAIAPHPASAAGAAYNLPAVRGESGLRVASDTTTALSADGTKLYRVQPPLGRHHDTLWEIAQRHLGDGRRYREIYELNKDRVQPDGSKLTNAALIRPGWILMMPVDATGGDLVVELPPTPPDNSAPIQSSGGQPGNGQLGSIQSDTVHFDATSQGTNQQGASSQGTNSQGTNSQANPSAAGPSAAGPSAPGPSATMPSQTASSALKPVPSAAPPPISHAPVTPRMSAAQAAPASAMEPATDPAVNPPTKSSTEVARPSTIAQSADELAKLATAAAAAADHELSAASPTPALAAAQSDQPTPTTDVQLAADQAVTDQPATDQAAADQAVTNTGTGTEAIAAAADTVHSESDQTTAAAIVVSPAADLALVHQDTTTSAAAPAETTTDADASVSTSAAAASTLAAAIAPRISTSVDVTTADATSATTGSSANAGTLGSTTGTTALAGLTSTRSSHRGSHSPEESQPPSTDNRVLFGLATSPLLAAGLLKAIGRHRRRQLWNRVLGRRPVTPTGDGAVAEESIRVGASEVEVWFLDLALRGLSAGLAERGLIVPGAYAVRLRDEGIELLLNKPVAPDDPEVQPPSPWFTAADGRSWNFPRPGIVDVDAQAAHRRFAPYPGMVTLGATSGPVPGVGTPGSDRLMIDLEEARGLIGLDGPPEIRRAVLAALAVELATNSWSDRMTVTLVGFPGDLTALAPARVRHVRTLDEILPSLEIEAGERAKALAAAGLESVLDGRSRAGQASSFPPHFVLVSEEPHAAILARLSAIATTAARIGLGFVVAGDPLGATWQLTVGSDRRITAPALGIEARAQLLPEEQYAAVLGLFRAVCDIEGTDIAAQPAHQSVGYGGELPDDAPSVYAALLGPLIVTGVGETEPEDAPLLNEALVFLLHHRDGVHPRVLAAALWPRGATADVAEATFARLSTWLGNDPHGTPNLHTDTEGRLRLGPYVWSDWDVFISLQSRALYDASIPDQKQRDDMLKRALDLVRGPYLADREPNRYGWLAYEVAEAQVPAVIADTALQLADSCVASGEPEAAIDAVKSGMRGSPDDEELWRGLLRATLATQDSERLRGAIEGLYKRTWYVHGVQGLHPRTEALVNELMPDWREAVAA